MRGSGRQPHTVSSALALLALLALGMPSAALADEPVSTREKRLLQETGENTTVIDAFDHDDPFDANLSLALRQQWKSANIRRETGLATGGYVSSDENVAKYRQSVSTLEIGADIGLFRDLALSFRLPLILADSRALEDLDGSASNPQRLQDPAGEPLFAVPFKSPTRSGIDQIAVGLDYAILNQLRDPALPTWVLGLESRFSVGPRLHACNAAAAVQCPDPAGGPNSNGPSRDPGVSRGMTTLALHTIFARRYGYIEPYAGFRGQIDLPAANSDFGATSDLNGNLLSRPPVVGTFTVGTEVYPYENRESFQRLSLDFKVHGTYHSPGREYSELFDALGSSQARSLRDGNPGAFKGDSTTSAADPAAPRVYFTGITDQQAYGSLGGALGVTMQAGEYVKFNAGLGLTYAQRHLITATDACNPDLNNGPGSSGPCRAGAASSGGSTATGTPHPNHRQVIDLPGRRFSVDDTTIVDLWVSGVVMF